MSSTVDLPKPSSLEMGFCLLSSSAPSRFGSWPRFNATGISSLSQPHPRGSWFTTHQLREATAHRLPDYWRTKHLEGHYPSALLTLLVAIRTPMTSDFHFDPTQSPHFQLYLTEENHQRYLAVLGRLSPYSLGYQIERRFGVKANAMSLMRTNHPGLLAEMRRESIDFVE